MLLYCFPAVSFADIYVCDSTVFADLGFIDLLSKDADNQDQYIIDTGAGTLRNTIRFSKRVESPRTISMACTENILNAVHCVDRYESKRITINTSGNYHPFVYISSNVAVGSPTAEVSIGLCTVI
jgi:hypothetical protein